jgi:hypothetical protein
MPTLLETQGAIQDAAAELRRLDERLAEICGRLPEPARGFDILTELRGTVDCVRSDLLSDAIATLSVAATASESDLHRSFEERQRWLVAVAM